MFCLFISAPRGAGAQDEVDPLDAFMAGVQETVKVSARLFFFLSLRAPLCFSPSVVPYIHVRLLLWG